jgi:alkylation response protein AidB-like acyl-CoA dehydrogenase
MDFQIIAEAEELQTRARRLAEDFATRAATHDREASSPMENYAALQREGFSELNVPKDRGGAGFGLLPWSLAAEELAQVCPATALAFNMHLSIVGPSMEIPDVPQTTERYIADLVADLDAKPEQLAVDPGRAQSGLALLISRISLRISRSTEGRTDLERQRQKRRIP